LYGCRAGSPFIGTPFAIFGLRLVAVHGRSFVRFGVNVRSFVFFVSHWRSSVFGCCVGWHGPDERSSDIEVLGIAEGIGVVKLVVVVVVVVIMSADSIGVVEELVVVVIMSAGSIGIVEEFVVVLRSLVSSVGKRGIWVVDEEAGRQFRRGQHRRSR
jgi:hypothetical protein